MEILNRRPRIHRVVFCLSKTGVNKMSYEPITSANQELDAEIVATYVRWNQISPDYLDSGSVAAA